MVYPGDLPSELNQEEMRNLFSAIAERFMAGNPELAAVAEERATHIAVTIIENLEGPGADHPALPTLTRALKKLIFSVTDKDEFSITPTDDDINELLLMFYTASDGNLMAFANNTDTFANYLPTFVERAKAEAGRAWDGMDGGARMRYMIDYVESEMREDFD